MPSLLSKPQKKTVMLITTNAMSSKAIVSIMFVPLCELPVLGNYVWLERYKVCGLEGV